MFEVRTPSRLHFGLLAYNPEQPRQFGGVGLMIRKPDIALRMTPAERYSATGPMARRALEFARRFADQAVQRGLAREVPPVAIRVSRVPASHVGLGTGTQLGMAVARAMAAVIEQDQLSAADLASLAGRGARSAIGAHGFFTGGLVIEGGKRDPASLSPLLMQAPFPSQWRIVLVTPARLQGLAGERETSAFASMAPIPADKTAHMCRLVLLGLAPSVREADLESFSGALFELQQVVGSCFASAQGGIYASPLLEEMVRFIRGQGVAGVGQSSWGPTLYAITSDQDRAEDLAGRLQHAFELAPGEVLVTEADNHGGMLRPLGTAASEPH